MLLKEIYEKKRYILVDGPLEWRDALREGIKPLIADGSVEPEYGECLIKNIEQHGPYIVLLPGLAMPHATLSVAAGRNVAVLLEAAARNTILKLRGIDSTRDFIARHAEWMARANAPE